MQRCPVCDSVLLSREEDGAFPFCSERCRLVDLGNWLGERYRIAADQDDSERPESKGEDDET